MLLLENDFEIMQRRMIRPELAGERRLLRRDREQEKVIDRQHRPQQDGNADQQQLRLRARAAPGRMFHFDKRFIMKYTSGRTSGNAHTIAAIDRSTWSSRR